MKIPDARATSSQSHTSNLRRKTKDLPQGVETHILSFLSRTDIYCVVEAFMPPKTLHFLSKVGTKRIMKYCSPSLQILNFLSKDSARFALKQLKETYTKLSLKYTLSFSEIEKNIIYRVYSVDEFEKKIEDLKQQLIITVYQRIKDNEDSIDSLRFLKLVDLAPKLEVLHIEDLHYLADNANCFKKTDYPIEDPAERALLLQNKVLELEKVPQLWDLSNCFINRDELLLLMMLSGRDSFPHVNTLDLSGRAEDNPPPSLRLFKNLTELDLTYDDAHESGDDPNVDDIPDYIVEFPSLKKLSITCGESSSLPESIGKMNLIELNIDSWPDSGLKALPSSFGDLKYLQKLRLWSRSLTEIPDEFWYLPALEEFDFDVSHEDKGGFPWCNYSNFKVLEHLSLVFNYDFFKTELQLPKSLKTLDLSGTSIKVLPPYISNLKTLKVTPSTRYIR